jgi:hypothetical protein
MECSQGRCILGLMPMLHVRRTALAHGLACLTALAVACGGETVARPECTSASECAAGATCVDGACMARPDAGGDASAPGDAGCACGAGEVCEAGGCAADCGDPRALACGEGTTCDYATGRCAAEGTAGILSGEGEVCAGTGARCLPGTECTLDGRCVAAPPCTAMRCTPNDSTCWGRSCFAARPAGACAPATLERMNEDDFVRGGDGGATDLELDDACNAYTVTTISGTDYLRQLAPDGTLTVWNGVTNLNMGEVAALRRPGGEFGTGELGEVALTYVCCASCGCVGSDPQGVARLDREGATSLPMVITAMPSPGSGPFGQPALDTGPFGLTWGRDRRLYVGNVTAQGDLVRADLDTGATLEVHRLPARIHASATFDPRSLLVAVEGGEVYRVSTEGAEQVRWAELGEDVTSLVRDPFTGRVYASLRSARIVELAADGALLRELEPAPSGRGRLAYAPDGALYHLVLGWPTRAEVTRYELPRTR